MVSPRLQLQMIGAAPDLVAADVSAAYWSQASGVVFLNGAAERMPGARAIHDNGGPPAGPYLAALSVLNASGEIYWLVVTDAGMFAADGNTWHNVTPSTGWTASGSSLISVHCFNGVAIINCSVKGPFYWNGNPTVRATRLPGWPSGWRCMSMRSHAGFLFAIGRIDEGGLMRVNWSDAAEAGTLPGSWEPTAENLAGWVDLLPASSPCVDGFTLGNDFLVFKGESVHAFTFAGGNDVFSVRQRFNACGMAGLNAWAFGPSERAIFAGSDGDIYITDGLSLQSVLKGRWQRQFYQDADPLQFTFGMDGATLHRMGVSLIGYRRKGKATMQRAMVYEWASGEVSVRSLPNAYCLAEGRALEDESRNAWDSDSEDVPWRDDTAAWNEELVSATNDDVVCGSDALYLLSGDGPGDIPEPVYLLREGADLGNSPAQKLVRRVWPRVKGVSGQQVRVRIGMSDEAESDIRWQKVVRHTIGSGLPVDVLARGRFLAIEIQSANENDEVFSVGMIEVEAVEAGQW